MKKILIITDAWRPQVNGVVRVLEALIPELRAQGCTVSVIESGQFFTLPLPLYPEIRLALFARRRLRRLLQEAGDAHIHVATEGPLGWAARAYCRKHQLPFSTWYHSHFQLYFDVRVSGLLRPVMWAVRRFHSAAQKTFVSTSTLKAELERVGFNNLTVVPLGVDTKSFTRVQPAAEPALAKPVYAYFSRLAPEKSPEEFFKLQLPGAKLVIGDGPLRAGLEKKYGETHRFVGYQEGSELVEWLSRADVMIFPSRTETFGLVVLEALSCGVPVAAHDVMGPRDIITSGVDGYLGEDLADAAQKCSVLSRDACRTTAKKYSWERTAREFIKNL